MSIRYKKLKEVNEQELQSLIDDEIREGKEIEYKENLPGDINEEKMEFLADVSSFANTSGGDLLFGFSEKRDNQGRPTGVPSGKPGISAGNPDLLVLRLENIIRDSLQPRVMGISIQPILLSNGNHVVIIRIPKSWIAPHMVAYRGSSRFYARNSAGKYQLDVGEIKSAFLKNETVGQRVRDFRVERLSKIMADEGPMRVAPTAKIILHLVPLQAFEMGLQFDVNMITNNSSDLQPMYSVGFNSRLNFDGLLSYSDASEGHYRFNYLQIFRNGCIEAIENLLLAPHNNQLDIPSIAFEREILDTIPRLLSLEYKLGVDPPLAVLLTLVEVFGYRMSVRGSQPIDRASLIIPEVIVEDFNCDVERLLRPCFDIVWNATGLPTSINYDDTGKWVSH